VSTAIEAPRRGVDRDDPRRKAAIRTGLLLLAIALLFFFGIIAKYWLLRR